MSLNPSMPAPPLSPTSQTRSNAARLYYPACAWLILAITLYGFQHFYFHGQAFPGRPLTPPIRTLLIVHGVTMLLWVLLFIVQPILIAKRKYKLHMKVGRGGALLALIVIVFGYLVGVGAARANPPDLELFGMRPPQFLYVPLTAITTFGVMVALAIYYRKRPDRHRTLMLVATVAALSAAMGRFAWLNELFDGTAWFQVFGPLHSSVSLGLILLAVRCAIIRRFDTALAIPVAAMALAFALMHTVSATNAWDSFARFLIG